MTEGDLGGGGEANGAASLVVIFISTLYSNYCSWKMKVTCTGHQYS